MMEGLVCIICSENVRLTDDPVKKFELDKWKKVKKSAEERNRRPKGQESKYWAICKRLPSEISDKCGYHTTCYKNFTSVSQKTSTFSTKETEKSCVLRSETHNFASTSSGVLPSLCIFCNKARKTSKRVEVPLISCEYDRSQESVKEAAKLLGDGQMLAQIGNIDFHSKEVKYHNVCKRDYLNRARSIVTEEIKSKSSTGENKVQERAFRLLVSYVQTSVLDNNRPEFLGSVYRQYCQYVDIFANESNVDAVYLCQRTVGDNIVNSFGNKVKLEKRSKKQGLVLYNSTVNKDEALGRALDNTSSDEFKVIESAHILHSSLVQIMRSSSELPASLSMDDFKVGQAQPPNLLMRFFEVMLCGSETKVSEKVKREAASLAQDALYCATNGRVKPAKHLCLGLGMKSLTGSRKIVDILNRFGHSISYSIVEGIETEIASSITDKERLLPDMLIQESGLCTGTAFDNYDELTETLSGKGTLHDTVGICYQNISHSVLPFHVMTSRNNTLQEKRKLQDDMSSSSSKRRRRQYDLPSRHIEPYKKKPSIKSFTYDTYENVPPDNLEITTKMDQIWMLSCLLRNDTPMWRGWNSVIHQDHLPQQDIGYIENITLPPTRLDVVQETLSIAQKVAQECGDRYAIVHYDLAIAKPALQIQAQESPKYDNVFICFGAFHISMAYFGSLGYLLESSGCPEVLCNADVLASGSVQGLLTGKHFNRCKRLHPLFATALQILHFRRFAELNGAMSNEEKNIVNVFAESPSQESLSKILQSEACNSLLARYNKFTDSTRHGEHGKTAMFWVLYIDLVHLYLLLERACRTNDVDLYIYTLGKMCPIFFATHRPNYARWMTRYHLNLLNMENTHEGIRAIFEGGALSIRRTPKNFSRTAIDLTLEQTVNKDAASRQGGIAAFTQCVKARKRWTLTRSFRGAVIGTLLEMVDLTLVETVSQELKPYRIAKDNSDLTSVIQSLEETLNPFKENLPALYCLSTGRATSTDVQNDLTDVMNIGNKWYQEFVTECKNDPKRFQKPIKRRKVKNFAHDAIKSKLSCKDHKIKEVKCTRDIFGRLLFLAVTKKLDLANVLSFPLTPVPLSLCHINGAINKTDKSTLFKILEAEVTANAQPDHTNVYILDAMFFLRTLPEVPPTFGGIARVTLQQACTFSKVVHIVCDTYTNHPSIKDNTRDERGNSDARYTITGPSQRRPTNFNQALLSSSFKVALLHFLRDEWTSLSYADILEGHTVYFALDSTCFLFKTQSGAIERHEVEALRSEHEEADTRIIFHSDFIGRQIEDYLQTVVVRSSDTDVFVLLLYHASSLNVNIWMDTGLNSNNTRRMINISSLAESLPPEVCSALPGFHAFTGSDYTASFLRKGKRRPYDLMLKNVQYTAAFSELGMSGNVKPKVFTVLEEFVCGMYGVHKKHNVNDARLSIFNTLYSPRNEEYPMSKINSSDPGSLPPCKNVLSQKIKRTNYVAHVWKNARNPNPVEYPANSHGWQITDENKMEIIWFEGPQYPEKMSDILVKNTLFDDDYDDDDNDENVKYSALSDEDDVDTEN